jgi:uncharacterized membrane protein YraQ (UPF0718 family)
MNNKEVLSTRQIAEGITAGVSFLLAGPFVAFVLAAAVAGILSLPFNPVFYAIWGLLSFVALGAIVGGIKASRDKRISN